MLRKKIAEKLGEGLPLSEVEKLIGLKRESNPIDIAAEAARLSLDLSSPNWRRIIIDRLGPHH